MWVQVLLWHRQAYLRHRGALWVAANIMNTCLSAVMVTYVGSPAMWEGLGAMLKRPLMFALVQCLVGARACALAQRRVLLCLSVPGGVVKGGGGLCLRAAAAAGGGLDARLEYARWPCTCCAGRPPAVLAVCIQAWQLCSSPGLTGPCLRQP